MDDARFSDLKQDPQATVAVYRKYPKMYLGKQVDGFQGRYALDVFAFANVESMFNRISSDIGGGILTLRFSKEVAGRHVVTGTHEIVIDEPPVEPVQLIGERFGKIMDALHLANGCKTCYDCRLISVDPIHDNKDLRRVYRAVHAAMLVQEMPCEHILAARAVIATDLLLNTF